MLFVETGQAIIRGRYFVPEVFFIAETVSALSSTSGKKPFPF
jgi:hypothetical protein